MINFANQRQELVVMVSLMVHLQQKHVQSDKSKLVLHHGVHGETVFAYADKTVGYGSVCASETRYCNDGILDGSFQYASCSVGKPIECPLPR